MSNWRINTLFIIILIIGGIILGRLFSLQILEYDNYQALAQDQHQLYQEIFPERGEIFIQDLSSDYQAPLAINKEFQQAYLVPKKIPEAEKEKLTKELASILEIKEEIVSQRINKPDDPYEPLRHKVDKETADKIRELDIPGIGLAPETWRYYPNESLACHLTGFLGIKDDQRIGQYGLEGYYQDKLKGECGFLSGQKDTSGYWIPSLSQKIEPAQDGARLILTLDQNIQFKAEKELKELIEKWEAAGGTIIIMEPQSGAIRAMASWPIFNPNQYNQVEDINVFLNPAIQQVYEPGSVFKPITMAAGLESGLITPESVYEDKGAVNIKGSQITNVDGKSYGLQTMTQILEKSLNTGAVFVQQKIGPGNFQDYVSRFNFNQPTGVDLIGEISGDISNLYSSSGQGINLATISFGQGITVTPLGLITALGAIANQGRLMRPFVVQEIIQADGQVIKQESELVKQVVSKKTAEDLTKMLVSVVDNGFGKPAAVEGYSIAGKTGTAQMADLEVGGYSEETIHTFVGYGPAFDAQFIILIKLDQPQGIRFAADSVSPVFKELAEYLFNYLEIPPQ